MEYLQDKDAIEYLVINDHYFHWNYLCSHLVHKKPELYT